MKINCKKCGELCANLSNKIVLEEYVRGDFNIVCPKCYTEYSYEDIGE